MSQDQSISANEPTVPARLPRLERAYQKAASIRDRVRTLKTPARSSTLRQGTRLIYFGLFVAMIVVLALIGSATLPTLFGYNTYAINGGSMEPTLKLGSAAVTKPTSPFALNIGDIISVTDADKGSSTLHRIVDITTVDGVRQFITQGDQNRTPDVEPVVLTGFGDKVVYSVPYAGYLLNFGRSWLGRLLLLGTPLVFVASTFAGRFRSMWRRRRSEAVAVSPADNEGSLTLVDAVSEPPPELEGEPLPIETAVPEPPPELEEEPVVSEKAVAKAPAETDEAGEAPAETEEAPGAIENPVAAMLTESTETPVPIEVELPEAAPEAEDEPAAVEDAVAEVPGAMENPVAAMLSESTETTVAIEAELAEATPEAAVEPAAVEDAVVEAPAASDEDELLVVEAAPPEAAPESEAEPIAIEAELPEATPESEAEPVAIEATLPGATPESDEEPIAIEAALPEATPESDAEPIAIEATLPDAKPEAVTEPVVAEPAPPETPIAADGETAALEAAVVEAPAASDEDEPMAVEAAPPETPPVVEEEPVAVGAAAPEAKPEAVTEPVAVEATLPETPMAAEAEPIAIEAAVVEAPAATDEGAPLAVEAAPPEATPESEAEPIAIEAELPEATPEAVTEPIAIEAAARVETLGDVPDSPFPIEAALELKAKEEQAQTSAQSATPGERPALRIVSSSDSDGGLPTFLVDQMKRRHSAGERADDQQEAGEAAVA